jgi:AGZA family xanthine/uracil permease-like MFS transporter
MPMARAAAPPRWFVPEDVDGFFGLFFSGLPDLLLIAALCPLCGLPAELVTTRILPAIAVSVVGGNLFYAWMARRLALATGRDDVTAIPFGVNAPTIFAYIFLIMLPVYRHTHDPMLAWHMGIFACFLSGVIQTVGSFCTDWMRRSLPAAATLGPLAGGALAFLCLGFILQIFAQPLLALVPTIVILASYASRLRLPGRLPVAGLALGLGMALYWGLGRLHVTGLPEAAAIGSPGFYPPHPINLVEFFKLPGGWQYFSVILPLALIDTLAAVQILESVRLAGDNYPTRPALLVNGLATLIASLFGSAFPTTLYFGHLSHKANGARIGYSILNAIVVAGICLTGLISFVLHFVPYQLVAFIIVWFGLEMVGQAFTESGRRHGAAVAIGLVPLICAWGLQLVTTCIDHSGLTMAEMAVRLGSELPLRGLIALSQGAFLTSMVWAAATSYLLDRRFLPAAAWFLAGSILSFLGIMHAFALNSEGVQNRIGFGVEWHFAASYAAAALFLVGCEAYRRHSSHAFAADLPSPFSPETDSSPSAASQSPPLSATSLSP